MASMCPYCGWQYNGAGLVPHHTYGPFDAQDCPGVGQGPRNPESDRRPLWKDLPPLGAAAPAAAKRTDDELAALLASCPVPGTRWRHYKGGQYLILDCVILEATQTPLVVYTPFNSVLHFARPLSEWGELVEFDGQRVPRFKPVEVS